MLDTFKSRLKAKYSGVNLSQKRIDAIADRLHKKFPDIKEEADHDAKIDDYYDEETVKDMAKEDDRIRTLEAKSKEKKDEPAKQEEPKTDPAKNDPKANEMPEWFKPFAEKITKQEQEEKDKSLKTKLKEKLKDVPEELWSKRTLPQNEDTIDGFVKEATEDYQKIVQSTGGTFTPGKSSGKANGKQASEKEINNLVDNVMGIVPAQN